MTNSTPARPSTTLKNPHDMNRRTKLSHRPFWPASNAIPRPLLWNACVKSNALSRSDVTVSAATAASRRPSLTPANRPCRSNSSSSYLRFSSWEIYRHRSILIPLQLPSSFLIAKGGVCLVPTISFSSNRDVNWSWTAQLAVVSEKTTSSQKNNSGKPPNRHL